MIRRLNSKEEQVMSILWTLKRAFIQDLISEFPSPQPHYNTISSIVRKLENEGYVSHVSTGRSHQYFPIASKKAYKAALFEHLYTSFFGGSKKKFFKYTIAKLDVSKEELKALIKSKA